MGKDDNFKIVLDDSVLDSLIKTSPQKAGQAIRTLAQAGRNYVVLSFNTSPPGRSYKRGKKGKVHIASKAGYPPSVDSGVLRAGIGVEERGQFGAAITSSAEYGPYLEFGTAKMGARPFMRPMFEWLKKQVTSHFQGFI